MANEINATLVQNLWATLPNRPDIAADDILKLGRSLGLKAKALLDIKDEGARRKFVLDKAKALGVILPMGKPRKVKPESAPIPIEESEVKPKYDPAQALIDSINKASEPATDKAEVKRIKGEWKTIVKAHPELAKQVAPVNMTQLDAVKGNLTRKAEQAAAEKVKADKAAEKAAKLAEKEKAKAERQAKRKTSVTEALVALDNITGPFNPENANRVVDVQQSELPSLWAADKNQHRAGFLIRTEHFYQVLTQDKETKQLARFGNYPPTSEGKIEAVRAMCVELGWYDKPAPVKVKRQRK